MNFPRARFSLLPVIAAAACAIAALSASLRAAGEVQAPVVALPPFMVEEATKGPPWRYAQTPEFEILSRCDDATTRELADAYHRLHRLLTILLPERLQVKHAVQKTIIFYNEEMRPAASQEIITQMMRGTNLPAPPPDAVPEFGGRGFRGGGLPQRRVTFLPNMRLWDRDAMAIFAIVRAGGFDADNMVLTPDYVSYLARNRTPTLPTWLVVGLLNFYPQVKFRSDHLSLDSAVWVSDAETRVLKSDPKKARPLLPIEAFLRGDASANNQTKEENLRVWASQAELLIRWGLDGKDTARHEGFWKFVERSAAEPLSERLLQECLGLDYAGLATQLTAFLPTAVRKDVTFHPEAPIKLPTVTLRNATDGEIARIKGDWERLEIDYVRRRYPDLAPKYVEQARRTLLRAYERDDRDPRLVAILGLCECDAGNDTAARGYLEEAARLQVVRPRAWYELARLRYAERLATPAANGRFSAAQAAEILTPLFTARRQDPPLPEVYELIADVWSHSAAVPTAGHLGVVFEGVRLFPRRMSLLQRAAALAVAYCRPEDAASYVELGLRIAETDTDRAAFTELQARLPAVASPK